MRTINAAPKRVAAQAAQATFTLQQFRREALWAAVTAAALLLAVLCGRTDIGAHRVARLLASWKLISPTSSEVEPAPFDAQAVTRQLAQAVRGLAEDHERLIKRVAAVERDVDDMTGSITREIEAVKAASASASPSWPSDSTASLTQAEVASLIAPPVPPTGVALLLPPKPATQAAGAPQPNAEASPSSEATYGADVGGALSFKSLHAHWAALRSAHPQLFDGLRPAVTLREATRSSRTELRLVIGPFANAAAAAQLCVTLAAFRQPCQPTMFDGRLALQ